MGGGRGVTIRSLVGASEGYDDSRFSIIGANPNVVEGSFESIATVTVGAGGAANIEFTDIPSTYQNLQIRYVCRSTLSNTQDYVRLRLNSVTTNSYAYHGLRGDGSTASAEGGTTDQAQFITLTAAANATASIFGAYITDILDYASTSKATTVRTFGGHDRNGAGTVGLYSGLWTSTNAVSTVRLYASGGNWAQYSTFALYGIRS